MSSSELISQYLERIGVAELPPKTISFDPGYDAVTVKAHLEQSAHLMSGFKLSMSCWQISDEATTLEKIAAAKAKGLPVMAGGGPFEIACAKGALHEYLNLCQHLSFDIIEAGEGFVPLYLDCKEVIKLAAERGLTVQYELGQKHEGAISSDKLSDLLRTGERWLEAGAKQLIVEARENAEDVGLFTKDGELNLEQGEQLVKHFGLESLVFEAPNKKSQFAFLRHFGEKVELSNVRLEEILRVEIFRRGLHPDSFTLNLSA